MSNELVIDLSQGTHDLTNALQATYPEIDTGEIEVLTNAILGRMSQVLTAGERLASVRLRPDGNFDLRIWDIDRQGSE
jgi:hypothetical protein